MVKVGSIWFDNNKEFMVIHLHTAEDGHTWIHYREHCNKKATAKCKEYSCYQESFTDRFRERII